MRALITGSTGFVGSHLVEYLLENTDWDIYAMARWRSPLDNLFSVRKEIGDRVKMTYADVRDAHSMTETIRQILPDYVFHLAAQSYPKTSFTAPGDTLETNIQGTLNLLEAVRSCRPLAWVHVCSSSEVYGRVTPDLVPITESCPFMPASPYAISKVGADLLGRFYAEAYGLNVVITRMFTHTGPRRGDVFFEATFAKQVAMILVGGSPPIKVGNLGSRRTIADVRDAVRAYHMALTVNPVSGEVYNIGGDTTLTVGQVLDKIQEIAGTNYPVEVDPDRIRPIDADLQVPDCSKFKTHTGWEPQIPFDRTMRDLLNYWRTKVATTVCLPR